MATVAIDAQPAALDSDGDGMSDRDELAAGTDPTDSTSRLRILLPLEPIVDRDWRISWQSVSGRSYRLQRWNETDLNLRGEPVWIDVQTIVANGPVSFGIDRIPEGTRSSYYRVTVDPPTDGPPDPDPDPDPPGPDPQLADVDPERFIPLDAQGLPLPSGPGIPLQADGSLGPFVYRPGGPAFGHAGPGFEIHFPEGARLIDRDGQPGLEFTRATAGFASDFPIQLESPLTLDSEQPSQLRLAPFALTDLMEAFAVDGAGGLPVRLFERYPLRWTAGTVGPDGLQETVLDFSSIGLPLPQINEAATARFQGGLEFQRDGSLRIPFHGAFSLSDGSSSPLQLSVTERRPLWLRLHPDGGISLWGRAEALFPNGGRFAVNVTLGDPVYRLQIASDDLQIQALSGLADLLPGNPSVCLPASPSSAQLDQAARCLESFAKAYHHFCTAVAAVSTSESLGTGDAPFDSGLGNTPPPLNAAASALKAWGFSALTPTAQALPLDQIADLIEQFGRSTASASDLPTILANREALLRIDIARRSGSHADSPALEAELQSALAAAEAGALKRANTPEAIRSLESLDEAVRMLVEARALQQEATVEPADGRLIDEALPRLIQEFAQRFADAFGIQTGDFTGATNDRIQRLGRFQVFDHLNQWFRLLSNAATLGVDASIDAPVAEMLGQLAHRLTDLTEATLVTWLEAGVLQFEMIQRFGLASTLDWETSQLAALVERIGSTTIAQHNWPALNRAVNLMLDQADRWDQLGDQARRGRPLQHAATHLASGRQLTQTLFNAEGINPALRIVDMLLPGNIEVDRAAGAIEFHRTTGRLDGSLSGRIRIPGFGTALTVNRASFSTGGRLDINAFTEAAQAGLAEEIRLAYDLYHPGTVSDIGRVFLGIRTLADLRVQMTQLDMVTFDYDGDGAELRDEDEDGLPDGIDNCLFDENGEQTDTDGDGLGDACDPFPSDANLPGTDACERIASAGGELVRYSELLLNCARASTPH